MIHIVNVVQLDLRCKNLVIFSVATMIAHCVNLSYVNGYSNQISLCTEVSFNLKFAKC